MGVGYPLDLLVCSALGVDMFDCVYPCRTGHYSFSPSPLPLPLLLSLLTIISKSGL